MSDGTIAASEVEPVATGPAGGTTQDGSWRSRVVGHGAEAPDQLLANPRNWRIHPQSQRAALEAALEKVGWLRPVIVNRTTGHVVDGHLRVSVASSREETSVPVTYVELTEDEERAVLATHDPLAELAQIDKDAFAELTTESGMEELAQLMATEPVMPKSAKSAAAAPTDEGMEVICPYCAHEFEYKAEEAE